MSVGSVESISGDIFIRREGEMVFSRLVQDDVIQPDDTIYVVSGSASINRDGYSTPLVLTPGTNWQATEAVLPPVSTNSLSMVIEADPDGDRLVGNSAADSFVISIGLPAAGTQALANATQLVLTREGDPTAVVIDITDQMRADGAVAIPYHFDTPSQYGESYNFSATLNDDTGSQIIQGSAQMVLFEGDTPEVPAVTVQILDDDNNDQVLNSAELDGVSQLTSKLSFDQHAEAGDTLWVKLAGGSWQQLKTLTDEDIDNGFVEYQDNRPAEAEQYQLQAQITTADGGIGPASEDLALVDTTGPTVTISSDTNNLANGPATITFSFDDKPFGFELADITSSGGTLSQFSQQDDLTWTAVFTSDGQDPAPRITIANRTFQDQYQNDGTGDDATLKFEALPLNKPTIDLAASSDSGKYDNDDLTNDTTPTFVGKADANVTVDIYIDGVKEGETRSDDSGNWSYTFTRALNDDEYDLTAVARLGTRESEPSDLLAVEIDTVVEASTSLPAAQQGGAWFGNAAGVRFVIDADEQIDYAIKDIAFHWGSRVWYNPGRSITANGTTSDDITVAAQYTSNYSHGWFTFESTMTDLAGNVKVQELTPVVVDPIASLKDGGYIVTFIKQSTSSANGFDIFAQRYNADGSTHGEAFQVNSHLLDNQTSADVSGLENGGFVITWQSAGQDGDGLGVFAQVYDQNSQPVGSEIQVNSHTGSDQQRPVISSLPEGGFVIAWMSDGQDGSGQGIYLQIYSVSGDKLGGELLVNQQTASDQAQPTITTLDNGNFVVSWQSAHESGNGYDIYAKVFNAQGQVERTEFLLNQQVDNNQTDPSISATSDGGFVTSWLSRTDSGDLAVMVQKYKATGAAIYSSDYTVAQGSKVALSAPEVAGLNDGSVVVTWAADDGDDVGVYISKFSADGQLLFAEQRVNDEQQGIQSESHIVALEDGGFLVTWTDINQGTTQVMGQRYTAEGSKQGEAFVAGQVAVPPEVVATVSELTDSAFVRREGELNFEPLELGQQINPGDVIFVVSGSVSLQREGFGTELVLEQDANWQATPAIKPPPSTDKLSVVIEADPEGDRQVGHSASDSFVISVGLPSGSALANAHQLVLTREGDTTPLVVEITDQMRADGAVAMVYSFENSRYSEPYSFSVVLEDKSGTELLSGGAQMVLYEGEAPSVPTVTVEIQPDSNNDQVLNSAELDGVSQLTSHLSLDDHASAGDVVWVKIADGSWQVHKTLSAEDIDAGFIAFVDDRPAEGQQYQLQAQIVTERGGFGPVAEDSALVDTVGPTVEISASKTTVGNAPVTITFSFDEQPEGFSAADIQVTGGQLSNLSQQDDLTWTAQFVADGQDKTPSISIGENQFQDQYQNPGHGDSLSLSYTRSGKPDAPSIEITQDANNDGVLNSAEVSGRMVSVRLSLGDNNIAGDKLRIWRNSTKKAWRKIKTLTQDDIDRGYVDYKVPKVAEDKNLVVKAQVVASNNKKSDISEPDRAHIDTLGPKLTIEVDSQAVGSQSVDVLFNFDEAPKGFAKADINVTGGELSGFTKLSSTQWKATFSSDQVTKAPVIAVANGLFTDRYDNTGRGDELTLDAIGEPPTKDNTSIHLDENITADDIVIASDADRDIAITGRVEGIFSSGDVVTLTINGSEFSGELDGSGKFSILVPGQALIDDPDNTIEATVEASNALGTKAPKGEITDSEDYSVNLDLIDTDRDGIVDTIDIDDDNDGILDIHEVTQSWSDETTTRITDLADWQSLISSGKLSADSSITVGDGPYVDGIGFNYSGQDSTEGAKAEIQLGEQDQYQRVSVELDVVKEWSSSYGGVINARFELVDQQGNVIDSQEWRKDDSHKTDYSDSNSQDTIRLTGEGSGLLVRITELDSNNVGSWGDDWSVSGLSITEQTRVENNDIDGDGRINSLDMDSDNDGITDNVEAQTTQDFIAFSGIDANGDGLDDAFGAGFNNVDKDGDGILDYLDQDSDNDGVLDIVERGDGQATSITSREDADNDGLLDIFEHGSTQDYYNFHDGNVSRAGGAVEFTLADSDDDTDKDGSNATARGIDFDYREGLDTDGDNIEDIYDVDDDNDGILDIHEVQFIWSDETTSRVDDLAGWQNLINSGKVSADSGVVLGDGGYVDGIGFNYASQDSATGSQARIDLAEQDQQKRISIDLEVVKEWSAGYGGEINARFELVDQDGNVIDSQEWTKDASHNANYSDTSSQDTISLSGEGRGLFVRITELDSDQGSTWGDDWSVSGFSLKEQTLTENNDIDGDGIINSLDLDSDNDGITDNIEAQTTQDFIAFSGIDANGDGLDDAFGAGFNNVDKDGDGYLDFVDQDSDNDGILDIVERGDGQATSITSREDSDRDGLLDIFEHGSTDDNYNVYDGNISRPGGTTQFNLADSDDDTDKDGRNATGRGIDFDYREGLDTDADNVEDIYDIDDDNDGILDVDEAANSNAALVLGGVSQQASNLQQWQQQQQAGEILVSGDGIEVKDKGIVFNESNGAATSSSGQLTINIDSSSEKKVLVELTVAKYIGTGSHGGVAKALFELQDKDGNVLDKVLWHSAPNTDNNSYYRYADKIALQGEGEGLQLVVKDAGSVITAYQNGNDWGVESYQVSEYQSAAVALDQLDSDGDGIINSLDLDSDNDGITDNVEAQHTQDTIAPSGIDANQDGLDDAYGPGLDAIDFDGDGVRDAYDSDADNDGILDIVERGDGQAEKITSDEDTDRDGLLDIFEHGSNDDNYNVHDGNLTTNKGEVTRFNLADSDNDTDDNGKNANDAARNFDYRDRLDTDLDGVIDIIDLDDDDDGILDTVEFARIDGQHFFVNSPGEWLIHQVATNQQDSQVKIPTVGDKEPVLALQFLAGAQPSTQIELSLDSNPNALVEGVFKFHIDGTDTPAGQLGAQIQLVDNQGQVVTSANYIGGQTGMLVLEGKGLGLTARISSPEGHPFKVMNMSGHYSTLGVDSDGDGLIDSLDIDSDNDGILDNVEAQLTESYQGPSRIDSNNDGVDDRYQGNNTIAPVDTDGDGTADYLDSDSDSDQIDDIAERGDGQPTSISSTADSDGDGLLDIFENGRVNDAYIHRNENSNYRTGEFTLADSDNDVAADGSDASGLDRNLDYRDNSSEFGPKEIADGVILGPDVSIIQRGYLTAQLKLPSITLIDDDGSEDFVAELRGIPVGATLTDDRGNSFVSSTANSTLNLAGWNRDNITYDPPGANEYSLNTLELVAWSRELENGTVIDTSESSSAKVHLEFLYQTSPLVLDMDGDGVETVSYAAGVLFDIDGDGHKDITGWAAADDALLVHDINGDGQINDASELFGEATRLANGEQAEQGFAALADLDSNADGRFDSQDQAYKSVQIWQDKNQDGLSQQGELLGLEEAGIAFIDLAATQINEDNQGNTAGLRASWGDSAGQSHDIDDIWFTHKSGANGHIEEFEGFQLGSGESLELGSILEDVAADAESLDSYLNFVLRGEDTHLSISKEGSFDSQSEHADKLLVLRNTQLEGSDQQIIQQLLDNNQLNLEG